MRGKKRIPAILMAVILGMSLGVAPAMTYAEPETDVGAAAEEEKELTPEELEKKAEEDAYNMEIQSNGWKNWPQDRHIRGSGDRDGCGDRQYLV